ncbi:MAG: hypothetical protein HY682_00180 [Chloroflexi bacterium]|nr:hypothetical protein [Chloroflexota bacterium]
MRTAGVALLSSLTLAGCTVSAYQRLERGEIASNYHLLDIKPQRGQSTEQLVADREQCERVAVETPNATGRTVASQTVPFFAAAMAARNYSAWRDCMLGRGYEITQRQ